MTNALPCGCDPATFDGPRCARGHALASDVREAWEAWIDSIRRKVPARTKAEFRQLYYEARDKMQTHYAEEEAA